jgi:adenylylsulfate kinase-like enzyme
MFSRKHEEVRKSPTVTADVIRRAIDLYVEEHTTSPLDVGMIREELAQALGFEQAQRMVNRIAIARGQREVGVSYNARRGAETR